MERLASKSQTKSSGSKYVALAFIWGLIAKVLDAGMKLFTVPLLLHHYGSTNFGVISLAISVNAYLQLLDLGINTGAVKFFSQWIKEGKRELVDSVARTSISFYGLVGVVNALILLLIAFYGIDLFKVSGKQAEVLQNMLFILAGFAIFNWATSVFSQLLVANEKIYYIQQINMARSVVSFLAVLFTIYFKLSLISYFILFTGINSLVFVPFYIVSKRDKLISGFKPALDFNNFLVIFRYSIAIIAMGIFQMTASKSRPIILSIFANEGLKAVAEFRILETITIFVISLGGMFSSIFLPKTSRLVLEKDKTAMENFAYESTLYTSIICVLLCAPFMLCAEEIITIYVGVQFAFLSKWLIAWMIVILSYLHSSPVNSLLLAKGRTKTLVYSTAFSCIVSLCVNALLSTRIGVGAAIIGHSVYILIQMSLYYLYFNNKILGLRSWLVFKSFIVPAAIGGVSIFAVTLLPFEFENLFFQCIIKSTVFLILFALLLMSFRVVAPKEFLGRLRKK
ncbi:MATE family efflux transporter [Dyadobacter crusticola]|uniref:MATE family efflux transporter n=1 Tax=Dyadobacter crusticola TaxID=292407 RepID=UPI0004E26158|nr:polysaccharide biosynthesis C-terminal domain-containing protein [Dyadobacter crusticola]